MFKADYPRIPNPFGKKESEILVLSLSLSVCVWIRKLWYIYTMEYSQPLKRIHLNQF